MDTQPRHLSIWEYVQLIGPRYVAILLLVCVGLRIILFGISRPWTPGIETQRVLQDDAAGYHRLATTLIESHRFAFSNTEKPDAMRTPLYPMFIAAIYSLFGYKPWIVILTQILIDTISCFLLLVSLSRLFSRRVALIASTLYALDPFLILYSSTTLLSDTLFVFFLVAAFWFLSLARHGEISKKTLLNCGLSSLFLGLATLTRPISQFIIACFVVFFSVAYWKRPRIAITYALLSLLIFGLTLFPWVFRNYSTFGHFSLSTSDSYNLLILDVAPMEMGRRHEDSAAVRKSLLAEADKMMEADGLHSQDINEFQRAHYWRKLAVRYISNAPIAFGRSYLLGVFHTFCNLGTRDYAETLRLPAVDFDIKAYTNILDLAKAALEKKGAVGLLIGGAIAPYLLITYLGAIIGLLTSWRRQYDRPSLLLTVLLAVYFVLITGVAGLARFKLPSIPFYLAFTGIGFSYLYEDIIRAKRTKKHSPSAIAMK
jgi:4-amino-4-deoxy-L-arabinose transferase-like glycosyltransferase